MRIGLRFLTRNEGKFRELSELIDSSKYELLQDSSEINELQTEDMNLLVRDKVLKAFDKIRRPLIVDHTGLQFDLLNGFPAGLTSVFYDKLQPEGMAKIIGRSVDRKVTAVTLIGYCDGKKIHSFEGRLSGLVAEEPRGTEGFQWDTVFIPDGYDKTFAELGNRKKNEISMRRLAFNQLAAFLERTGHV
jgi:XTP/dITP diphosphohydrolase